jgi:hypothetical protein
MPLAEGMGPEVVHVLGMIFAMHRSPFMWQVRGTDLGAVFLALRPVIVP